MHAPRPRAVRFSLSLSLPLSLPPFLCCLSISLPSTLSLYSPLSTDDFLVLHSAASLIVHVRLDARNGVACSAINGTLRFSRSSISPRTSLFVRESTIPPNRPIGFAEDGEVPRLVCARTIYTCTHAGEASALRYRDGDLAEPRASYRSTQSVAVEIITGVAILRLSDVCFLSMSDVPLIQTKERLISCLRYHVVALWRKSLTII